MKSHGDARGVLAQRGAVGCSLSLKSNQFRGWVLPILKWLKATLGNFVEVVCCKRASRSLAGVVKECGLLRCCRTKAFIVGA